MVEICNQTVVHDAFQNFENIGKTDRHIITSVTTAMTFFNTGSYKSSQPLTLLPIFIVFRRFALVVGFTGFTYILFVL